KVAPNVVNVVNLREPKRDDDFGKRLLIFDPDNDRKYIQYGVGSGILVKPGYVLTNFHVVHQAQRLRLTFASGRSLGVDPDVVTADPITDLARQRLPSDPPGNLRDDINVTTPFADSDKDVHVGDWALAIGSPLGLRQTVTQGVISAKGRLIGMLDLVELLQTDAAINPGNSGGPLFDQFGRVAGINVAIASDNGGNQGIGFAIPTNTARAIFRTLVQQGGGGGGYLGVLLRGLSRAETSELGVADTGGVLVMHVEAGKAASRAGLQVGDVIVRFNGKAVGTGNGMRQLRQWILRTAPETRVAVEVVRNGERQALTVTVARRPARLG